ncbi:UDP-glucosyltransferase 2-like [Leptopilina heterotoma]|uniref:UDP-glucosyltransferase 2-like n=1 Tax=Leptopilina heterotoma TaxID=63436 RepID=UPI001CA8C73A|nr:UDP-glucosyltransferase 2-like [Leptopilina heterotoma]
MNFLSFFIVFYSFLIELNGINGYRILAIFPYNARSHNNVFEGVTKALARNGHQIDVVSHFELKKPLKNYNTIINLEGTRDNLVNNFTIQINEDPIDDQFREVVEKYGNEVCELLGLPELQNLIKNPPQNPPYDLFITEMFCAQCFIGIGHVLKVPVITISSTMEVSWFNDMLGNPNSAATIPNLMSNLTGISTFWNRLENTIQMHKTRHMFYKYSGDAQTKAMRKYLDPNMPDIRQVERDTALTFFNSFYTLHGIKSRTAAVIQIGGIHFENFETELPSDFKEWMDESKNGVVIFTLGSMALIESLPKETILAFYAAFEKIAPIRVLMKIVNKEKLPPGLPANVRISTWLPQYQLIQHNNTILFMTHGGLLTSLEVINRGIPTIGFPLFGDQFANVNLLVKKNMSIIIDYKTITEEKLTKALNSVLFDPIYRESAKRESKLFRDRPFTPSQTVNYWVEYIIRNGPNVLRSPSVDLQWWENELLDVYGFIALCFLIIATLLIVTFIITMRLIFKLFHQLMTKSIKLE